MLKNTVIETGLSKSHPHIWMPMIQTADIIATKFNISRERQDLYALESQKKIAEGQKNGFFMAEISPMKVYLPFSCPYIIMQI
jgi:acetyl-CoA C-acetyltransferase